MEDVADTFARALRFHQNGDLPKAEALYRQILASDPNHADTLHLLGFLRHQTGHSENAVGLIRQAIALNPTAAVCHANLGIVLMEQGKREEAVASYRQALRLHPGFTDALGNLALALKDLGQADESADCCRRALAINPQHAHALNLLGNILKDQKRLPEAIDCYERALRVNPRFCDALSNLGLAVKDQGQVGDAIHLYRQALEINPDHAIAHNNLAITLTSQGDFAAAAAGFEHALLLKPDYASARWNRALLKLLHGDFFGAWPDFECRWQLSGFVASHTERPLWDGTPLEGKTILLYAEQGLGDTIQFVRYAPMVRQLGGTVLIECQTSLVHLVAGLVGAQNVFPTDAPLPPFDFRLPLLSLPGLFRTELTTVPADVPYLRADPSLVEHWSKEMASLGGFKIGIAWQGSPTHEDDRNRSVPLRVFESLARLPGVRLVSVQVGSGTQQLESSSFAVADIGSRFDPSSFDDLAAALMNLDLVVTVDTAVAHLAGALGVPVWIALPCVPDWRWQLERSDSPWYPTMRLFRQRRSGDWDEVFGRIARELEQIANSKCDESVHDPLSPRTRGERAGVRGDRIPRDNATLLQSTSSPSPLPLSPEYRGEGTTALRIFANLEIAEKKISSQNGEDGVLDAIFAAIGVTNRYFVEFGVEDGTECNTANLRRHGWSGLMMDGDEHPGTLVRPEYITAENINDIFAKHNVPREFDLLSIDIDGNDYFVWQALTYRPRAVVIEYNAGVPPESSRAIVYDPKFKWDNTDYFGASLRALAELGKRKGYELVYCERAGGNAFFIARSELPPGFVAKPIAELYRPPNYHYRGLRHRPELSRVMIDPTANGLFEQAVRTHQTHDLAHAETLYRQLLDVEPFNAEVHHLLGLLKREARDFAAAAVSIRRAIDLAASAANYHVNLGLTLAEMGETTAAIECYRSALGVDPDCVDALKQLGLALKDQREFAEAAECFRHVLRLYPTEVDAHNNLGNLLRNTGRFTEAEQSYRRALRLKPDHASAHNNLGIALAQQGRVGEAIACFREALRLNPRFVEARNNLEILEKPAHK